MSENPNNEEVLEEAPEKGSVELDKLHRKIFMVGSIEEGMVAAVAPILFALDLERKKDIDIVICSGGGIVESGIALYGLIRQMRNRVVITGYGQVQSMASIVMQAADHRILEESCRFMIHDGSVESPEVELQKHLTRAKETSTVNDWCNKVLSKRSGLSLKKVTALSGQETYMSAQEAVNLGLADEVLRPRRRKWKRS